MRKCGITACSIVFFLVLNLFIGCGGGDSNSTPTSYTVSGSAQKGPFQQGTSIIVYELDTNLNQTGISFQTEMHNNLGEYTLPVNITSQYVELFVDGFFFNEIQGRVYPVNLSLSAIADLTDNSSININLFTTLAKPRVMQLVSEGISFGEAKAQANAEILSALGFSYTNVGLFEDMDILKAGEDNALLLAASSIILQMASKHDSLYSEDMVPALRDILTAIKNDMKADGSLDDLFIIHLLKEALGTVDVTNIMDNLVTNYQNLGSQIVIPDFEPYIVDNALFPITGYEGEYGLSFILRDGPEFFLDLTISNQFIMSGSLYFGSDASGTGAGGVLGGEVGEDGLLTLTTSYPFGYFDLTGKISEDGSVEGTVLYGTPPTSFSGSRRLAF